MQEYEVASRYKIKYMCSDRVSIVLDRILGGLGLIHGGGIGVRGLIDDGGRGLIDSGDQGLIDPFRAEVNKDLGKPIVDYNEARDRGVKSPGRFTTISRFSGEASGVYVIPLKVFKGIT